MPRVFTCPECHREIDEKKDKYEILTEKPVETRIHPECKKKRRDRASEITRG